MRSTDIISKKIPKIIHIIWAGGRFPMTLDGIENVANWAKQNPGFEVWLWVDKKTTPKETINNYNNYFAKEDVSIQVLNENEQPNQYSNAINSLFPTIKIKDITDEQLRDEYVKYEIENIHPNYGASSDILRYKILFKYGGVYVDCTDVQPNSKSTLEKSNIFNDSYLKHVLYVDHCSQEALPEEKKLSNFNLDTLNNVGNDAFISTKENPVMKECLDQICINYDTIKTNLDMRIRMSHESKNLRDITIERTGPQLVQKILKRNVIQEGDMLVARWNDGEEKNYVKILPLRNPETELTLPSEDNTLNWLNASTNTYDSEENILESIFNTIQFEINHFRILRIDDHINDYIAFFKNKKPEENIDLEFYALNFIEKLKNNSDLDNDIFFQITGMFEASENFCRLKDYPCILNLNDRDRANALRYQSNLSLIENSLHNIIMPIKKWLDLPLLNQTS